jgi:hypothetical protein
MNLESLLESKENDVLKAFAESLMRTSLYLRH